MDDDVDLALYYLRLLSHVFRWAPESIWGLLAKGMVSPSAGFPSLSEICKFAFPPLETAALLS